MVRVFIDTGAVYAIEDVRDRWHGDAVAIRDRIEADGWVPITTSLVVGEAVTLIGSRFGTEHGYRVGMRLLTSRALEIVRPDASLEAAALSLYRKMGGRDLSFADALGLHVIRSRRIEKVFTFDRHFERCGAEVLRG